MYLGLAKPNPKAKGQKDPRSKNARKRPAGPCVGKSKTNFVNSTTNFNEFFFREFGKWTHKILTQNRQHFFARIFCRDRDSDSRIIVDLKYDFLEVVVDRNKK